jgi:hypothetical protein
MTAIAAQGMGCEVAVVVLEDSPTPKEPATTSWRH